MLHACLYLYQDLYHHYESVPNTTKVVSLNSIHSEVYSIQHYVIKFVSDLRQVSGFLRVTLISSTNKTERNDTTEISLKVALNTINQIISETVLVNFMVFY
jgi:uncharacterized membrane protein affecting hemolysin expression